MVTSAWRLEVTKQKNAWKKLVFWLLELGLQMDGIRSALWGGGVRGQNALLKIVTKQYLGHLMILKVVGGGS